MAYGKGGVSSSDLNQHKRLAGAGMKGSMDVSPYPGRTMTHPDIGMKHVAMDDSMRAVTPPGKGMPRQGAPDHGMGKGAKDHFNRGGMA